MPDKKIIECIPNFSEGKDKNIIDKICDAIVAVKGVDILATDIHEDANRTVITFAGEPKVVLEAAFICIKTASSLIDMRYQQGKHPRIGAVDVFPLVPIQNISMQEVVDLSHSLAKRVGNELNIPVYCYEESAFHASRKNLENIRKGEYEGLSQKIKLPEWQPDFGPTHFNARSGAIVIGARKILIAYNVNIDCENLETVKNIAATIRESGRTITDTNNKKQQIKGLLKNVKAIGWHMADLKKYQVSTNITDINTTPLHIVFETIKTQARLYRANATGSELIGLIPLQSMIEAGLFYGQNKTLTQPELIAIAIKALGLNECYPFNPNERIIEYKLNLIK
jgi:glutamate formiminotransferase